MRRPSASGLWLLITLSTAALGCSEPAAEMPAVVGEAGNGFEEADAQLGDGFVVWESNRSGRWRLWIRPLDEAAPRQLTPDEGDRRHCCPHVAPGGDRIAYLSLPPSERPEYGKNGDAGVLRLIGSDGSGDRPLAERSRTYFENRAAVWLDERRLVAIDGEGRSVELDVETGVTRPLTTRPLARDGWLLDPTLRHATTGWATFSPYDRERRAVAELPRLGGCQPYFSRDGRWGYWMAGAGGPIHRIELASREVSSILAKNDEAMPEGRGYLYFPMLSASGGLLAFAASPGEHDHFRGDYDIFVAETDPETLELLGRPVRMTRDPAVDRFPDVYQAPLALGRQFGEAPLTARFEVPGRDRAAGRAWRWSFGDGTAPEGGERGPMAEHTFERPGTFSVRATADALALSGLVTVRPSAPPRPLGVELRDRGARLVVRFDEPVDAAGARFELASGIALEPLESADLGRAIVLRPAERLTRPDRLTLSGITDRAERPNPMPTATLEIAPPLWPSRREKLVYLWESATASNLVAGEGGLDRVCRLQPVGRGRFDRHGALVIDGGGFETDPGEGSSIREALQAANEFTLEATLEPWRPTGEDRAIVALVSERRGVDLALLQRGDRLLVMLRIGPRGPDGLPTIDLGPVPIDRPSHLVVAFSPGRLAAYLDGESLHQTSGLRGDLFHWSGDRLLVGGPAAGPGWRGSLWGLAIYGREMGAAEARENALRRRAELDRRPEVERLVVVATPEARTPPPTLEAISPYRDALALSDYRVERVVAGGSAPEVVRVAEWVLLDGRPVARPEGAVELVLEPFAAQPQLESVFLADGLPAGTGRHFFAVAR